MYLYLFSSASALYVETGIFTRILREDRRVLFPAGNRVITYYGVSAKRELANPVRAAVYFRVKLIRGRRKRRAAVKLCKTNHDTSCFDGTKRCTIKVARGAFKTRDTV